MRTHRIQARHATRGCRGRGEEIITTCRWETRDFDRFWRPLGTLLGFIGGARLGLVIMETTIGVNGGDTAERVAHFGLGKFCPPPSLLLLFFELGPQPLNEYFLKSMRSKTPLYKIVMLGDRYV